MTLSLRLIALLVAGVTLVVVVAAWSEVRAERFALQVELQQRAEIVADRLREAAEPALRANSVKALAGIVERLVARQGLGGVAVYNANMNPVAVSARHQRGHGRASIRRRGMRSAAGMQRVRVPGRAPALCVHDAPPGRI